MSQTKGWQLIKGLLEAKRDQTFPDPQTFTDESAFIYAAKVVSIYKKVVSEILIEIENQIKQAEFLKKKEDGTLGIDPFAIGQEGSDKDAS